MLTTKTLRRRFFSLAGRLTRSARRLTLHLPQRWPWENQFSGALAFTIAERKRVKHVWTYWGALAGQLRPALAAQHRLGRPNPVRAVASGKTRARSA